MPTIEELEREFHAKLGLIEGTLARFHENLGRIGSIIGKDPTYVYDILKSNFDQIKQDYSEGVSINVASLSSLISREDKILEVLEEVNYVLKRIEESKDEESIDVKNEAAEIIENLAKNVENRLQDDEVSFGKFSLMGYLIPGLATFVILKYGLKQSTKVSLIASGAVAILMGSTSAPAIEGGNSQSPPMIPENT